MQNDLDDGFCLYECYIVEYTNIGGKVKMNYYKYFDKYNMDYRNLNQDEELNIFDVEEAFNKGTIFKEIYDPYKNYQSKKIVPRSEKEALMLEIQKYGLSSHDLNLYLDIFPNDKRAVELFSNLQRKTNDLIKMYQSKYCALSVADGNLNKIPWNYSTTRFPWEVES